MSVNMVVRKGAYDGFIMPAASGAFLLLPTWVWLFFRGKDAVSFFLSSPAKEAAGGILLVCAGYIAVKISKMVWRAWKLRDLPILDMDDDWITYRRGGQSDMGKVLYRDMLRAHLRNSGEESTILVIELMPPAGFMPRMPEPIIVDLSNTNAQPEDVCDAIAERIVRQNPRHGQGDPLSSPTGW